jgi:excisionase family DNA binding protein
MKAKSAIKTPRHEGPTKIMTVRDVSAYLHVHPSTIYRLLKYNRIPAFSRGERLAL